MKRILTAIPLLCLVVLLGSCVKEPLEQGGNVVEGQPAMVSVSLTGAKMGSRTRALTDDQEKEIKNIHVMIFDTKGNLVTNTHFDGNADNLSVPTTSGSGRTIFVVANGDVHTDIDKDLFKVTKLTDLDAIAVTNSISDLTRIKGLIMTGKTSAPVDIQPGSATLGAPIQLKFLSAKVTLKLIDNTAAKGENVQVYGWDVVDAAGKTYLVEQAAKDAVDPTQKADFFTTTNNFEFEKNDPATNSASQVLYLFENRRGGRISRALPDDVTKQYPNMGKPGDVNQLGKGWYAPASASYIVIRGMHTGSGGAKQFEARIYLGLDNHSNYDIARGNDYQFTVTVNGIDEIDIDSNVDYLTGSFKLDHGTNLIMDAHPDFRPIRIWAPAGDATIEILDENGKAHNEAGFSATWLKISPLNLMYHQVKQTGAAGDHQQDGVPGDFVRAKYTPFQTGRDEVLTFANATYGMAYRITDIPFTNPALATAQMLCVYADEFLTIDGTRTAQVKVSYLKTGDAEIKRESRILALTQRGPLTIFDMANANAGLERLNEDGTSSGVKRRFVIEQFEEVAMAMNPGIDMSVQNTNTMQWGFRDVTPFYDKPDKYRNGYFMTAEAVYTDVGRTNNEPTSFGENIASLKPKYGNGKTGGSGSIPNYGSGANTGAPYYYPEATNNIYHPIYKSSAARYCHEKNRDMNGDGFIDASETKWYLPSQQELQMIWIANNITPKFVANNYWSATQNNSNNSWGVTFSSGVTGTYDRAYDGTRVRCVREIF